MSTTRPRSVYASAPFWAGLAERTVESAAAAALAALGTGALGVVEVDWAAVASVAALAAVVCVLRCLAQPEFVAGEPRVPLAEARAGVWTDPAPDGDTETAPTRPTTGPHA